MFSIMLNVVIALVSLSIVQCAKSKAKQSVKSKSKPRKSKKTAPSPRTKSEHNDLAAPSQATGAYSAAMDTKTKNTSYANYHPESQFSKNFSYDAGSAAVKPGPSDGATQDPYSGFSKTNDSQMPPSIDARSQDNRSRDDKPPENNKPLPPDDGNTSALGL
uniref:Uncharacterized protein n=1 Tax=Ditylenchus dipsaci TaxID=166011 RepID=A0A915DHS0_9BILA